MIESSRNMMATNDVTGVILCGGTGSRLFPITKCLNKHLLPLFSKPMFYYPLSLLLLLRLQNIIFVCNAQEIELYKDQLKFLEALNIDYKIISQAKPGGIVNALECVLPHLQSGKVITLLGDNIFHGAGLVEKVEESLSSCVGLNIFTCSVSDPERFGIVVRNEYGDVIQVVEKPVRPMSDEAVTGLYIMETAFLKSNLKNVEYSRRGEKEISDLINQAILFGKLECSKIARGIFWIDAGTIEDFYGATEYIRSNEKRSGELILSPEEIALKRDLISRQDFLNLISKYPSGMYKTYLKRLISQ